jgi:hypothetical protein
MTEGTDHRGTIHWTGDKPADWPEWEAIARGVMRQWRGGGEVSLEGHEGGWRVTGALALGEPRDPRKDNARRHRITEALRARGKPAGLNRVVPS